MWCFHSQSVVVHPDLVICCPFPTQARGYKAYLDVLVRRAVEGNAWQADHILPVYKVRPVGSCRLVSLGHVQLWT